MTYSRKRHFAHTNAREGAPTNNVVKHENEEGSYVGEGFKKF